MTECGSPLETSSNHSCPACGSSHFLSGRTLFDDRYGHPDLFKVMTCSACGHAKTFPPMKETDLGDLYSQYYPRRDVNPSTVLAEASSTGGDAKRLLRWWQGSNNQGQYLVKGLDRYLDVGCGNGNSLIEARMGGADAFGIEADPNVRHIADALNLQIKIGSVLDDPFPGQKFDVISLNQVVEHIPEPEKVLEFLRGSLATGGTLFLSCPNRRSLLARITGARWLNWHIPFHLNHFDQKSISLMLRRCGYRVVEIRTITPNIWLLLQLRALADKPRRGVASRIWSSGWSSNAEKHERDGRSSSLVNYLVKQSALVAVAVIARLIDLFGVGESLAVVAIPERSP